MSARELRQLIADNEAWLRRPQNQGQAITVHRLRSQERHQRRPTTGRQRDSNAVTERRGRPARDPLHRRGQEGRERSRSPLRPAPAGSFSSTAEGSSGRSRERSRSPPRPAPAGSSSSTVEGSSGRSRERSHSPPRPAPAGPSSSTAEGSRGRSRERSRSPPRPAPAGPSSSTVEGSRGRSRERSRSPLRPAPAGPSPSINAPIQPQAEPVIPPPLPQVEPPVQNVPAPRRRRGRVSWRARQIARLPTRNVTSQEEGERCPICIEDYQIGEQLTVIPCNHFFHLGCISDWLRSSPHCPLCRNHCFRRAPQ
ncbi:uncharacterized protein ACNLHF_023040 [Anomaloglossus baeobatrachus]|uniref:uncharacterized protein LOC142244004 n=1 Tax=Anomaloglossus baeobatrachus TaxID=238106 RepID=UPI003F4F7069